mmetsp:Transcript_2916/g.4125  ORF Transcript_2916/g.4125 Transcript_2916/m.4125 type:complete len:80 (-) Transcript_2916:84-323(-)
MAPGVFTTMAKGGVKRTVEESIAASQKKADQKSLELKRKRLGYAIRYFDECIEPLWSKLASVGTARVATTQNCAWHQQQ